VTRGRRFGSLRWRLVAIYAGVAAAMLAVVLVVVGAAVERSLVAATAERLEIEAGLIVADAGGGKKGPRATDLAAGDLAAALGGRETAVTILDPAGATLATVANGAAEPVAAARLASTDYASVVAGAETVDAVLPAGDGPGRVLLVAAPIHLRESGEGSPPTTGQGQGQGKGKGQGRGLGLGNSASGDLPADGLPNAVAQLAVSLDPVDAAVADLRETLLAVGLVVLLLAVALAWVVTSLGLRPLGRVAAAADRIAAGDLSARAGLGDGGDEIGRLGRAFDGMADRVDATLRAQREFAADASHELKSPLTVLGGYVDILGRGGLQTPEAAAATLASMRREIDRLSRLATDLLLLNQLEAGGGRLSPRDVDLGALVADLGDAARVMGADRHVEVVRDGPLPIVADPDRLTQALMNLVDNAVRHAPVGGRVALLARREGGTAVAEVENDGEPIPREDLPRVFDRFYRRGGRAEGHAGLGLAIARAIVEASGGSVAAASDAGGTRFTVRLPLQA
jgi:two-component system OmpR family sensor kinase